MPLPSGPSESPNMKAATSVACVSPVQRKTKIQISDAVQRHNMWVSALLDDADIAATTEKTHGGCAYLHQ